MLGIITTLFLIGIAMFIMYALFGATITYLAGLVIVAVIAAELYCMYRENEKK